MPGAVFLEEAPVELRTIEREDIAFFVEHINDPQIWRPICRSRPLNTEQEEAYFENVVCDDDSVTLLIADDGDPVGTIALDPIDLEQGYAELGYWVAPQQQQQSYGTVASRLLVAYGFDQLGLHRVHASVVAGNEGSRRLLESLGFSHEGTARERVFLDGQYRDLEHYGVLAHEW